VRTAYCYRRYDRRYDSKFWTQRPNDMTMRGMNMAKPQLHQFAFGPNDFVNAVDTGLPGLWAVVCNGIVMVARRGGVWYEPRGNEAKAAADALSLYGSSFRLDGNLSLGKYVCADGHAVEDICGQCFEVFVILVNGDFQTVRAEFEAAFEVRDNFNAMFQKRGKNDVAQVVRGRITYDPKNIVSENG
jgi:hypothetical protein